MEKYIIEATESTPFIYLDPHTNILLIEGNSYPENSFKFYKPVTDWICRYLEQLTGPAILNFELKFINTGSSRSLLSICEIMDKAYLGNKNIKINWHYNVDNEMGQLYYEYFKENLSIPFTIIEKSNADTIVWKEKANLFEADIKFLEKIRKNCTEEIPENKPLYKDLNKIFTHYEKTLIETRRMIQISDLLEKNLKEINDKLTLANELKSQLIALALHDLKNPLSVITVYIDILKTQLSLTPKHDKMFAAMEKAASQMLNLIIEILENERIDLESIKLKQEKINMSDVINEIISRNRFFAEEKKQKLTFKKDDEIYTVYTDKIILNEIIENLVSNAIKYTPFEKQIEISLQKCRTQTGEYRIKTCVRDEGPGLSKNELGRLFKKFQKLSPKPTGNESSTGIGLYLSKKFAVLLKGKLEVESELGKGSVFSFEIPGALDG